MPIPFGDQQPEEGVCRAADYMDHTTMTNATLGELAEVATHGDQGGAIQFVLDCLGEGQERDQFLRGLTERILHAETAPSEQTEGEVARWMGSWLLSCILERDPRFQAVDEEASQLIAAGKIGPGITGADLRSRYQR